MDAHLLRKFGQEHLQRDAGICKFVPRYEKCLEWRGNYVEIIIEL